MATTRRALGPGGIARGGSAARRRRSCPRGADRLRTSPRGRGRRWCLSHYGARTAVRVSEDGNRALLVRTIRELSTLGYFDPEKINPDLRPNFEAATVDITFELEERPNDQIELSGGWGGFYGFVGTVGLVFNNFSIRNIGDFSKWPLAVNF